MVAPRWHTALLVGLFVALALAGAVFQRAAKAQPGTLTEHPNLLPTYLALIVMEWGLFLYVWKGGLRRTGTRLRDLIGGRWRSPADVAVDAGLAAGLWIVWPLLDKGMDRWFTPTQAASIQTLLPRRAGEILLWVALSISARHLRRAGFPRL